MNKNLEKIYLAAIEAVNPIDAVGSVLQLDGNVLHLNTGSSHERYFLDSYENIFVVGAGKATAPMAEAVEEILGSKISDGIICVKYGHTAPLNYIDTIEAAHPVPDKDGLEASSRILNLLKKAGKDDLVISLISGGGSALLPSPVEEVSFEDKIDVTDLLLKSGASIHEMNIVRKKLSATKGGGLAAAAYPADVINIMISDVVGDNMDIIASGPFVKDESTFEDAVNIVLKYNLKNKIPSNVMTYLKKSKDTSITSEIFSNVNNVICSSNIIALKAAAETARSLGYNTVILSSGIEGDTEDVADFHEDILLECVSSGNPVARPACILSGGEATVKVKGDGLGGRNMEFAMQFIDKLKNQDNITAASVGTDGNDGPTDASGAFVNSQTYEKCLNNGIFIENFKASNDSYHLFERIDQLIKTGPTNTNVMDIRILLVD